MVSWKSYQINIPLQHLSYLHLQLLPLIPVRTQCSECHFRPVYITAASESRVKTDLADFSGITNGVILPTLLRHTTMRCCFSFRWELLWKVRWNIRENSQNDVGSRARTVAGNFYGFTIDHMFVHPNDKSFIKRRFCKWLFFSRGLSVCRIKRSQALCLSLSSGTLKRGAFLPFFWEKHTQQCILKQSSVSVSFPSP